MQASQQGLLPLQVLQPVAVLGHLQPNRLLQLRFPAVVSLARLLGQLSDQFLPGLQGKLQGVVELAFCQLILNANAVIGEIPFEELVIVVLFLEMDYSSLRESQEIEDDLLHIETFAESCLLEVVVDSYPVLFVLLD